MKDLFRRQFTWAILLFGMAFVIRLIYLLQVKSNPYFYQPLVDELWNIRWAQDILQVSFWGHEVYFRGPLYPYLLAFMLKITGSDFFLVRLIQMVIASGSVGLTYLLGREFFSHRIALWAAVIHALYGTMIFYDGMFLIEVLFVFLNLLGLYLLARVRSRPQGWIFLLAGLVFGLSAIARPNVLLVIPMLAVWIYFLLRGKMERRSILVTVLIFFIGVAAAVLPVTVRNCLAADDCVLISSQGGINLYIGNNPVAEGLTMLIPEIALDSRVSWDKFDSTITAYAERQAGHDLKPSEVSSFWTNRAKQFIFEQPGRFLGLTFRKLVYFFSGFENSDQMDIYDFRRYSSLLSILIFDWGIKFPYGLVAPMALLGFALSFGRRRELTPLHIFFWGYLPSVILFLVTARHRLTVIPILILLAVFALSRLGEIIRSGQWKRLLLPGAAAVLLVAILNINHFDLGFQNVSQIHHNLAMTLSRQGKYSEAIEEYKLALAETPEVETLYFGLGTTYYQMGDYEKAAAELDHAVALDPEYVEALINLGHAYTAMADHSRAARAFKRVTTLRPGQADAYTNLGDACQALNDLPAAAEAYQMAVQLSPDDPITHAKLGVLFGRAGDTATAYGYFENFVAIDSTYAPGYLNWGNICLINGDTAGAMEKYNQAIRFDSLAAEPYYNLAILYTGLGERRSALDYLNRILKIKPDFRPAQMLRQRLED